MVLSGGSGGHRGNGSENFLCPRGNGCRCRSGKTRVFVVTKYALPPSHMYLEGGKQPPISPKKREADKKFVARKGTGEGSTTPPLTQNCRVFFQKKKNLHFLQAGETAAAAHTTAEEEVPATEEEEAKATCTLIRTGRRRTRKSMVRS